MKSRTSSCKTAAFKKDLTRFWPVWGSYLAIWLLMLPIPLITDALGEGQTQMIRVTGRAWNRLALRLW